MYESVKLKQVVQEKILENIVFKSLFLKKHLFFKKKKNHFWLKEKMINRNVKCFKTQIVYIGVL